ncbi:MAG: AAA family ATPase [Planctomycetota bacterium]
MAPVGRRGDRPEKKTRGSAADASAGAHVAADTRLVAPLGQGALLARVTRRARLLRMHHAMVIAGPTGSGKSVVARWLAAALLCPSDLDLDMPCGVCRTCRRVQSGAHPDLHVLTPEKDKREVKVDAVRALLDVLLHHAVEGRARVVLLDPASALNVEGQNALLKTLEEPGEQTYLLLPTARPELLLPTVRSRCERLGVRRLGDDTLTRELQHRIPGRERFFSAAVGSARGSLGRALLACTEQAVQLQDLVQDICDPSKPLRALQSVRQVLALGDGPGSGQATARAFLSSLRDHASRQLRALASGDDGSYPAAQSQPWTDLLTLALCAEQDLDVQIPPEQALVGLLLQWSRRTSNAARGS